MFVSNKVADEIPWFASPWCSCSWSHTFFRHEEALLRLKWAQWFIRVKNTHSGFLGVQIPWPAKLRQRKTTVRGCKLQLCRRVQLRPVHPLVVRENSQHQVPFVRVPVGHPFLVTLHCVRFGSGTLPGGAGIFICFYAFLKYRLSRHPKLQIFQVAYKLNKYWRYSRQKTSFYYLLTKS